MKVRRAWFGAVAASCLVHAALVGLVWLVPERATPAPAARPIVATFGLAREPADAMPGKLLPGDNTPAVADSAALAPMIEVPVLSPPSVALGPALAPGPGPGTAQGSPKAGASGNGTGNGGESASMGGGSGGAFFGVPVTGQRIVYVVDGSCSMGLDGAMHRARRELRAALAALPATSVFQVILFNSSARPLVGQRQEMLPATPHHVQQVIAAFDNVLPEGATSHARALQMALTLYPDVVYYLTDADDLSEFDYQEAKRLNLSRAAIHTIELTTAHLQRPDKVMQRLARETGGTYRAIDLTRP